MTKVSILLICATGMSTTMLVSKMKRAAKEQDLEVSIMAVSANEAETKFGSRELDIVLLGPQVRYMKSKVRKQLQGSNVAVEVVDIKDYGKMNGEKILSDALSLVNP